jgi:hypothetical protein
MITNPTLTWPIWTDAPITLFHGTTNKAARSILSEGVDLAKCRPLTDFGRGFYTTTLYSSALLLANRKVQNIGGAPAILRIRLNREKLGSLKNITFIRGALDATDFWSYVYSWRNGLAPHANAPNIYDVAYGPVARSWAGPANSKLYEGYDQISFHTPAAVMLLNDSVSCQTEIL